MLDAAQFQGAVPHAAQCVALAALDLPVGSDGIHSQIYTRPEKCNMLEDTFNYLPSLSITYSLRSNDSSIFPSFESYIVKTKVGCVGFSVIYFCYLL